MKKINQSGPFGRCLAGDAALTEEDRARVFSMAGDAVEMKHRLAGDATLTIDGKVVGTVSNFKADSIEIEAGDIKAIDMTGEMNWVFASSDRDALKPDNGDRRFATIEPAKSDNAQMAFYSTMLDGARPWPPISLTEQLRTLQQREELELVEAHLKALPPLPPVPRPWSNIYQDALDYFDKEPGK